MGKVILSTSGVYHINTFERQDYAYSVLRILWQVENIAIIRAVLLSILVKLSGGFWMVLNYFKGYIYSLWQTHPVVSVHTYQAFSDPERTQLPSSVTRFFCFFLNCSDIPDKGKISAELPIEITPMHRHANWHLKQENGDSRLDLKPTASTCLIPILLWLPYCLW